MEFWGVEVKPGQTVKCDPGDDRYLHVSQAALGETKKDKISENVPVFVKLNDQKIVLGTLSGDKFPQVSYDLVFEREFELFHGSKSTSVFFCGYKTLTESEENPESGSDDDDDVFEEIKNNLMLEQKTNGKPKLEKPISGKGEGSAAKAEGSGKSKIKAGEPKSGKPKPEEEDDDDDVSEEDDSDSDDDEEMADLGDDSDEDDGESSDEEDEATPQKAEISKKRAADSATKTPVPEKKTKLVSPTGGDGKKGHTATPHPAKQAGKTPANKSPKSGGSVSCKSCSKTFNSDIALQAHTKAKHA